MERLKDQDIDGVEAEVLYTTLGMSLFGLADAELQQACFRVYNDWLAEFCSHDRRRLHGVALISLADIDAGTRGTGTMRPRGTQRRHDLRLGSGAAALSEP